MIDPDPTIRVNVDATNPGQFFACCGLLELADRLWDGAQGWFGRENSCVTAGGALPDLIRALCQAELVQLDPDDNTASPIEIGRPFRTLRLDWWHDDHAGGKELKVWAGTMESARIACAMQYAHARRAVPPTRLVRCGRYRLRPRQPDQEGRAVLLRFSTRPERSLARCRVFAQRSADDDHGISRGRAAVSCRLAALLCRKGPTSPVCTSITPGQGRCRPPCVKQP